jgi:hypothetical protein
MITKMDWLRQLIIERIKATGGTGPWALDVYSHLIGHRALPDDAIKAMTLFADEAIAIKKMRQVERAK